MHVVLKHHPRFEDFKDDKHEKNRMMANIAMDAVINHSMQKMAIQLPKDVIMPDKSTGMLEKIGDKIFNPKIKVEGETWENVYMQIKKQAKETPGGYSGDLVATDKDKDGKESTGLTPEEVDDIIQDATNYSKLQGKLPAELQRILDEVYNTATPWQKILKQNMQSFIPFDYNYKKPNRRCYGLGTFLPQQNKRPSVKIYLAIDTSGSVSQEEMTYYMSEVYTICKQFRILEMTVMFCDAQIHQITKIACPKDIEKLAPSGYGGTDFIPVFEKMKEFRVTPQDILIYATDGYGTFPQMKPGFQTIWLSTQAEAEHYPFGTVIKAKMPGMKN